MKVLKKTALLLIALITYTSCNYLDIVPDEMDREENAFEDPNAALRYIYSCYSYLPQENQSGAIDMLTSDEIVTPFENEVFAIFLWEIIHPLLQLSVIGIRFIPVYVNVTFSLRM